MRSPKAPSTRRMMAEFAVALHYTPAEFYALTLPEYLAIKAELIKSHTRDQ